MKLTIMLHSMATRRMVEKQYGQKSLVERELIIWNSNLE